LISIYGEVGKGLLNVPKFFCKVMVDQIVFLSNLLTPSENLPKVIPGGLHGRGRKISLLKKTRFTKKRILTPNNR
jgi:hypothetical protein